MDERLLLKMTMIVKIVIYFIYCCITACVFKEKHFS